MRDEPITVRQLKDLLRRMPDEAVVLVYVEPDGAGGPMLAIRSVSTREHVRRHMGKWRYWNGIGSAEAVVLET